MGNLWSVLAGNRSTSDPAEDLNRVARSAFSPAKSSRPWLDPSFFVAGVSCISGCTLGVFSLRIDSTKPCKVPYPLRRLLD